MLSAQLKEKTKTEHQQLEVKVIAIIKNIQAEADYIQLLQVFAGFFGKLEQAIEQYIDRWVITDYDKRRKTALLHADLAALNTSALVAKPVLPEITSNLQALGALYVMEGSSLGGPHISKMIAARLPGLNAFSFFKGYGEDTLPMWKNFQQAIDNLQLSPAEEQLLVNSARYTFVAFSKYVDLVSAG